MADVAPAADILVSTAPALSATSDMPVMIEPTVEAAETPVADAVEAATETATETVETKTEPTPATPEPPKPDPRTTRARTAEDQLKQALGIIEQLTERLERPTVEAKPDEPPAPQLAARPSREDFNDPESYDAALIEWAATTAAARATAEATAEANRRAQEDRARLAKEAEDRVAADRGAAMQAQWNERQAKVVEANPDYQAVVDSDDLQISAPMARAIIVAERGPEIAYWLGKNPGEATRIAKLTDPAAAIIEIGMIAARLDAPASKPEVSRTPAPIVPVRSSAAAVERDVGELSMEEYAARRAPQLRSMHAAGRA